VFSGSGPTRNQIHDYHIQSLPDLKETDPAYGPFWTTPVPDESVQMNLLGDRVMLDLWDLPVSDSFQSGGPTNMPAKLTLHGQWLSSLKARTYRDTQQHFAGIYAPAQVQLEWSTTGPTSANDNSAFGFQSDRQAQTADFAQVGREATGSLAQ
jgi:hypothetical protein